MLVFLIAATENPSGYEGSLLFDNTSLSVGEGQGIDKVRLVDLLNRAVLLHLVVTDTTFKP